MSNKSYQWERELCGLQFWVVCLWPDIPSEFRHVDVVSKQII